MEMSENRTSHSLTGNIKYLITSCGKEHYHNSRNCEQYILSKNMWHNIPNMNQARKHHASCIAFQKVYVFGGEGLGSIEVMDMKAKDLKWTVIPDIV